MISYREHLPHPFLAPWVRCYWELTGSAPGDAAPRLERVLPDGCMEWVFHAGTPFRIESEPGRLERQSPALLVGVTTRAILLEPSRDADVLGVRFRPGGASAFLGPPAATWRDRILPLESAEDRGLLELHERVRDAARARRIAVVESALLERAAALGGEARRLGPAMNALLGGNTSVDRVAAACGLGPRQLQRRFREEVGVGPRQLARVGRLQRAARRLEGSAPLAAVAQAAGYADQAHFGREFLALAGTTPGRYRREAHALAAAFAGA